MRLATSDLRSGKALLIVTRVSAEEEKAFPAPSGDQGSLVADSLDGKCAFSLPETSKTPLALLALGSEWFSLFSRSDYAYM